MRLRSRRTFTRTRTLLLGLVGAGLTLNPAPAESQWSNRYPQVEGYGHHVYLEGYELPTMAAGPLDAVPSPDGASVVLAARGWLWILDPTTGMARQLTDGAGVDSRPAWSADGSRIAFIRDDSRDTDLWELELATGEERPVVETPALDLDPAYGPDGSLWFSSAAAGTLDLWRLPPDGGEPTRVTTGEGIELRPQPHPDGRRVLYLAKRGGPDRVVVRDLETGAETRLVEGAILSQLRPALSPDGSRVAYAVPMAQGDGWQLRVESLARPGASVLLLGAEGDRLPLSPAWSGDGRQVWFSEAGRDERMRLSRVAAAGGAETPVEVAVWETTRPTARLRVQTVLGEGGAAPARLSVVDGRGHPLVPADRQAWFDGQTGTVFFYTDGLLEMEVPAGEVSVRAVQGLATPVAAATTSASQGSVAEVALELNPVWDARSAGWLGGDHHFHLNYGGPYRLDPGDMEALAAGEGLDVATPVVANLHDRFGEQAFWGWDNGGGLPLLRFGQEVRSHFLGHMGLLGTEDLFWPWVWGPGYGVYGADDRPNAEATAFARDQGGLTTYVHPVSGQDPFATDGVPGLPTEMAADGVLGDLDAIEVACLWSDELGTADAWYRFLNLGRPVVPTAGTDVMTDFFRTMAVGTTRIYVHTGEARDFESYLRGLQAGRSFVTTGPLVDLRVEGARPGGVVEADGSAAYELTVRSAVPVDRVAILVNGVVVREEELEAGRSAWEIEGELELPEGGWIAARVTGPEITAWPGMDSYAFAHTSPVWIGAVGSTDPQARRAAAADLLQAVEGASIRLRAAYGGVDIPRLEAHFSAARDELERILGS